VDPSIRSIILILLACSSLLILGGLGPSRAQPPLLPHATINIAATAGVGNFTLTAGVTPGGTGTFGNPYVIENWEIITNSSFGIHIKNTHEFFIIETSSFKQPTPPGKPKGST